jgi:hypothetical protein
MLLLLNGYKGREERRGALIRRRLWGEEIVREEI